MGDGRRFSRICASVLSSWTCRKAASIDAGNGSRTVPISSYFVNDGKSLEMVVDGGIDFIFSFDSLVHAEEPVLKAYAAEFAKKLRPNGAAFLHHSNLGEYTRRIEVESRLSKVPKLLGLLKRLGVWDDNVTNLMAGAQHDSRENGKVR